MNQAAAIESGRGRRAAIPVGLSYHLERVIRSPACDGPVGFNRRGSVTALRRVGRNLCGLRWSRDAGIWRARARRKRQRREANEDPDYAMRNKTGTHCALPFFMPDSFHPDGKHTGTLENARCVTGCCFSVAGSDLRHDVRELNTI
jgi:hypothetical protein